MLFCELRLYNIDLFFTAVSYNRDLMKSGRATATQNAYIPTSGSTANWKSEHDAKYTPIEFAHDTAQRYDAYMIAIVDVLPRSQFALISKWSYRDNYLLHATAVNRMTTLAPDHWWMEEPRRRKMHTSQLRAVLQTGSPNMMRSTLQ